MMTTSQTVLQHLRAAVVSVAGLFAVFPAGGQTLNINQEPLFLTQAQAPLVMLVMARDHRLYYEAYNDYSDLDGDGTLDVGYKPGDINYYGYFDSFKCYSYSSSDGRFNPVSVTPTKQCGNVYWSGDFLNYVTTSRMDALRKVLFGGYRSTDTTSQTVLERVFIPQDAHSWGKEYESVARDGYDIEDYTPLLKPPTGRRHLFANTTLTGVGNPPKLRVLQNSSLRVWNWLSIERPVADANCVFGVTSGGAEIRRNCVTGDTAATGGWGIVPASMLVGLNMTVRSVPATSYPSNASDMTTLSTSGTLLGSQPASRIDCNSLNSYTIPAANPALDSDQTAWDDCNPFTTTQGSGARVGELTTGGVTITAGDDDYYYAEFSGSIVIPVAGTYTFAVDGNNSADLFIDGTAVAGYYGGNSFSACSSSSNYDSCAGQTGSRYLTAGSHTIRFRSYEKEVNDGYQLWMKFGTTAVSMTDFNVRVKVCDVSVGLETNCSAYTDGATTTYKPTGLLHNYSSSDGMYFGLLTGSYKNNLQGGVLRKNISSFSNEYSSTTGIFSGSPTNGGIVDTINKLRITSFDYGSKAYSCGWITTRAINNGECEMWGNPLGEMIWETIRYFASSPTAGSPAPTAAFTSGVTSSGTGSPDGTLLLPLPSWWDPYSANASRNPTAAFPYCAKPYVLSISDVYPSFDSDSVPGAHSAFNASPPSATLPKADTSALNVSSLGQTMWDNEPGLGGSKSVFIGQSDSTFDSAPTAKTVTSFGNIRGLAPSEPTRQGSFSSSALAYWAHTRDLRTDLSGDQKAGFYSIALSPPLPTIEIPVGSNKVTIVPFAKSVGGAGISAGGAFQPTNQIVDFYVDTIKNTSAGNSDAAVNGGRPYYRFRINYEDVEQGADHDMDAISVYDIWLNADNTVSVNVKSEYAAGGIIQHMGYVIAGTTADGTYLVVRDTDTASASDPNYARDTPNVAAALPLTFSSAVNVGTACVNDASNYACRTFTVSGSGGGAKLLNDPLWYMAKWGGFKDDNLNSLPDTSEWDADGDGVPDNYFLVVNPLKLEQQMSAALAKIAKDSGTASAIAANSTSLRTGATLYQARFNSDGWGGEINAYPIQLDGAVGGVSWRAQEVMAGMPNSATRVNASSRVVLTYDPNRAGSAKGIPFRWSSMTSGGTLQSSLDKAWNSSGGTTDGKGSSRVEYLRGSTTESGMRTRPCLSGTSGATCITNFLGDIIDSAIQYVGVPSLGIPSVGYTQFYEAKRTRAPMLYVGANDGMLHGFEASSGEEKLAYIPSSLYRSARLSKLTAADYGLSANPHAYYVDGSPTFSDVCRLSTTTNDKTCEESGTIAGWRTLLVGGLGGGGQGIYALDITDPSQFSETNASSLVLWEFTDENDVDLGLTYSRPVIVRLCTQRDTASIASPKTCLQWRWVVVFGNGYNAKATDGFQSTSNYAHLFIVDAVTGALLKKVATTAAFSPNGLNSASPIDMDADGVVDVVYATDLNGGVWKFDVSEISTAAVAYRLYQATVSGVNQPITTAIEIALHPWGGLVINFATGKYLEVSDKASYAPQTIYGIWDNGASVPTDSGRANLQKQELLPETVTANGAVYGGSTNNTVDWTSKLGWYLDMTPGLASPLTPSERVAYDPMSFAGILGVTTLIPSTDVCAYGGSSWFYMLNPLTGGRPDFAAFADPPKINYLTGGSGYASRRESRVGITPQPTIVVSGRGSGIAYASGSKDLSGGPGGDGKCQGFDCWSAGSPQGLGRRVSWRELEID